MKAWYEANPAMLDSFEVGCSESHEKAFSLHKEDMSQQKWWPQSTMRTVKDLREVVMCLCLWRIGGEEAIHV